MVAEGVNFWILNLKSGSIKRDHILSTGSKPLAFTQIDDIEGFENITCYGDYSANVDMNPTHIWKRESQNSWKVAYTFPAGEIQHIHAIIPDKRRGLVWILTGDFGKAAGIWVARNDFKDVSPVLVGEQEYRCCWLSFFGDRILYATDTQTTQNSLRELHYSKNGSTTHSLMKIAGSAIYSTMVQGQLVFSTAIEPNQSTGNLLDDWLSNSPGTGISGNYATLVTGNILDGFKIEGTCQKDMFPMRLCEFGSISFPSGLNPGNNLFAYFTGLSKFDGTLNIYELDGN